MMLQRKYLYEFGRFRLNPSERRLERDGARIPLTNKTFDTLTFLVSRPGALVTKEELLAEVWPEAVVEDNSVDKSVSAIRQALGDKPSAPEYVETVRGHGYRFVASVRELVPEDAPTLPTRRGSDDGQTHISQAPVDPPVVGGLRWRSAAYMLSVLLAATVTAFAAYLWRTQATSAGDGVRSIAVLPFRSLDSHARDESLELGMADTLITKLGIVHSAAVRPVSAVRRYMSLDQDPVTIGRALNVDAVLDGSIQRAGERIRVTARLLRVTDGQALWADEFDELFADIFQVQDAIADQVTRSLALRLSGIERQQLARLDTARPGAYELYLKGRYLLGKREEAAVRTSIESFQQAVTIDPDYALAYAALAEAYSLLATFDVAVLPEDASRARSAALRAIALNPSLAEAHTALGFLKESFEWDVKEAEREYLRAIALKPNDGSAHHRYGVLLTKAGRTEQAHAEFRRALELDPLSLIINADAGRPFYRSRDCEPAAKQYRKVIEMEAGFARAHALLAHCYTQMGRFNEAVDEARIADTLSGKSEAGALDAGDGYQVAYIYAVSGRTNEARRLVATLERSPARMTSQPYYHALAYAALGERDHCFDLLDRLYDLRSPDLLGLGGDPAWDVVSGDSRFQKFLHRMERK
jgi:DNA-binding winged helix-turn-helix (wHTH) protein/TolB-like protein/Tfp pilus assembly protein PilF